MRLSLTVAGFFRGGNLSRFCGHSRESFKLMVSPAAIRLNNVAGDLRRYRTRAGVRELFRMLCQMPALSYIGVAENHLDHLDLRH